MPIPNHWMNWAISLSFSVCVLFWFCARSFLLFEMRLCRIIYITMPSFYFVCFFLFFLFFLNLAVIFCLEFDFKIDYVYVLSQMIIVFFLNGIDTMCMYFNQLWLVHLFYPAAYFVQICFVLLVRFRANIVSIYSIVTVSLSVVLFFAVVIA